MTTLERLRETGAPGKVRPFKPSGSLAIQLNSLGPNSKHSMMTSSNGLIELQRALLV